MSFNSDVSAISFACGILMFRCHCDVYNYADSINPLYWLCFYLHVYCCRRYFSISLLDLIAVNVMIPYSPICINECKTLGLIM